MSGPIAQVRFGRPLVTFALAAAFGALACGGGGSSGGQGGSGTGSGGTTGSGGNPASGGTTGSGGNPASGGTTGSGGTTASGGATGTGGAKGGTSGATGSGGTAASGGTTGSGGEPPSSGGTTGSGGATASGGKSGSGGAIGSGGSTGSGGTGGHGGAGTAGNTGSGGSKDGGVDASSTNYTCNCVLGLDSTSDWYINGFETYVTDSRWQLIYNHPAYVEDWGSSTDAVYSKAPTSPCASDSTNPDRVILNVFPDPSGSLTTTAALVTGLSTAVTTIKSKYSHLKRLDLLTMSRAPNNQACSGAANSDTVVPSYVDDAIAMVAAANPGLVVASPKFYVTNCSDFDLTNPPHLSTAGKTNMAKVYGQHYSTDQ